MKSEKPLDFRTFVTIYRAWEGEKTVVPSCDVSIVNTIFPNGVTLKVARFEKWISFRFSYIRFHLEYKRLRDVASFLLSKGGWISSVTSDKYPCADVCVDSEAELRTLLYNACGVTVSEYRWILKFSAYGLAINFASSKKKKIQEVVGI